jgi:hypothetical protein
VRDQVTLFEICSAVDAGEDLSSNELLSELKGALEEAQKDFQENMPAVTDEAQLMDCLAVHEEIEAAIGGYNRRASGRGGPVPHHGCGS